MTRRDVLNRAILGPISAGVVSSPSPPARGTSTLDSVRNSGVLEGSCDHQIYPDTRKVVWMDIRTPWDGKFQGLDGRVLTAAEAKEIWESLQLVN